MKRLLITTVVVAIALAGFTAVLTLLPGNGKCCHDKNKCEMRDGDEKCSGDKDACEGKEHRTEKVWTDADGKVHREVRVTMGDGDEMEGGCKDEMNGCSGEKGKCSMDKGMEMGGKCEMQGAMQMHGCCCCCMMHGMMGKDSMAKDSVHVKIRAKL
jgi:hypothetical protein